MKNVRFQRRRGFTLIELLVVIGIIVGVLAMTVPLVGVMNGTRSIEAGFNVVSAALGHAREIAILDHQIAGAFVYVDPATGRSAVVYVEPDLVAGTSSSPPQQSLPNLILIAGEETELMPAGVGIRFLNDSGGNLNNDRYLSNGVILFDEDGNVMFRNYNVNYYLNNLPVTINPLASRLQMPGPQDLDSSGAALLNSLAGVAIYDRTAYLNQTTSGQGANGIPFTEFDRITAKSIPPGNAQPATADKVSEEIWLDQNATLALVRSGDGALVKGK